MKLLDQWWEGPLELGLLVNPAACSMLPSPRAALVSPFCVSSLGMIVFEERIRSCKALKLALPSFYTGGGGGGGLSHLLL